MKYTVKVVRSGDDDYLNFFVDDEEDVFIIDENGKWWLASEFFCMEDVKEFEIIQKNESKS